MNIVTRIRKKGQDIWDLDNYRGIHLLAVFRQLYNLCLCTESKELSSRIITENQQGFIRQVIFTLRFSQFMQSSRLRVCNDGNFGTNFDKIL